jgi:hypothetical protein
MLTEVLAELYERDLAKLKDEIGLYEDEADLWKKPGEIPNSAGNLCLHINGNLQHFFGAVLGGTGYVRNRDAEFSSVDIPRERLLAGVDTTISVIASTLDGLNDDDFKANYPIEVFGKPMTTGFFLTHLAVHLNWHLGQINYHRRVVSAMP